MKSRTDISKEQSLLSKANDLLIPSSGETALDIATTSCVLEDNILLGGDLNVIRLQVRNAGEFFAYYLSNFQNRNIARLAQGNSVVHLYASSLRSLKISIPRFEEQQKIAEFLTSLDDKIFQVEKEITKTKLFKKGLLQQMFV